MHTHVSIVQREGPGYALFSTDGSRGGGGVEEGVCMCVEGGFWSVFFLRLSTSKRPLDHSGHDDRTHPCVYTFTLSLSCLSINSSLHSLSSRSVPLPDKLTR